jgi:prepilin-type N-terminal cleavage/methylation domain-containing protein
VAERCMKRRGFTLIELLTVIAIIGILASLLIGAVAVVRSRARINRAQAETRELAKAWKAYWITYQQWPSSLGGSNALMTKAAMDILVGKNAADNPQGIRFMDIDVNHPKYINGFTDPWGTLYRVNFADTQTLGSEMYETTVFFPNRKRYEYE